MPVEMESITGLVRSGSVKKVGTGLRRACPINEEENLSLSNQLQMAQVKPHLHYEFC